MTTDAHFLLVSGESLSYPETMVNVTQILSKIESGDRQAASELLPVVYDELRKLAAQRMGNERLDHTLQATALVHEAYLRIVDSGSEQSWESRGHFFAAAAEAMRRILVDRARKRLATKHGGNLQRIELGDVAVSETRSAGDLLLLDKALNQLSNVDAVKAKLVQLRYFAGLTIPQAAKALGIGDSTADKYWAYAKVWLKTEMSRLAESEESESDEVREK